MDAIENIPKHYQLYHTVLAHELPDYTIQVDNKQRKNNNTKTKLKSKNKN